MTNSYRTYCRVVAVVFAAYTVYPVATKLAQDHLAGDWAHSALHLLSAVFAAYAGWGARSGEPARLFVWMIGSLYLTLGVLGWFTGGVALSTPVAIPLGPVDNVFHLVVGVPAAILAVRGRARAPAPDAQRPEV